MEQLPAEYLAVDIETGGFDPKKYPLLEIAMVALDKEFNIIASIQMIFAFEGIHNTRPETLFDQVVVEMHTNNGLLAEVTALTAEVLGMGTSTDYGWCYETGYIHKSALLEFMDRYFGARKPHLVGNSVHFDRGFIEHKMPELAKRFGHRNVDASAFYEMCKTLGMEGEADKAVPKPNRPHRAMDDILRSIELVKYYRSILAHGFALATIPVEQVGTF
jgi:oligoribonuclease (3'-5' exoribonuclease)